METKVVRLDDGNCQAQVSEDGKLQYTVLVGQWAYDMYWTLEAAREALGYANVEAGVEYARGWREALQLVGEHIKAEPSPTNTEPLLEWLATIQ